LSYEREKLSRLGTLVSRLNDKRILSPNGQTLEQFAMEHGRYNIAEMIRAEDGEVLALARLVASDGKQDAPAAGCARALGQENRMMHTYKYDFVNGHIIVVAEQLRLLIDTGAPFSVVDSSPLAFAGGSFQAQHDYMGISPESLSMSVGTPINALIGTDILNQYDILIDPTTNTFNLTVDELPLVGQSLALDNVMGIPIVDVGVGQDNVRMFFDTGAKLSYLDPDRTDAFQSVGTETDFYPGVGDFSTKAYDIPVALGNETVVLRVGNLPQLLQMTLMQAETAGILGTAILRTHKVTFAPRRNVMTIQRIHG
jgi:hypothetical protein